jgi:polysaccharide export outer membrane protein
MKLKTLIITCAVTSLSACASLPTNGPTGAQIEKSIAEPESSLPIELVQVLAASDVPTYHRAVSAVPSGMEPPPMPTDTVGPGDVLDVSVYEAGVSLFAVAPLMQGSVMAGVQAQKLPPMRVDDFGNINFPYVGRIYVAGQPVREIESMIRSSLRGMSQNPQVLVSIAHTITNSVIVSGEVARPGRLALQTNRERLSDVIALSGGYRGNAKDLTARLFQRESIVDVRLDDLADIPALDVRVSPGDRVQLIHAPRSFSVLGASGNVAQIPFSRSAVSLAEAIAGVGGVNPNMGDPAAIFLFRYEVNAEGVEIPKVYHLNMMKAQNYFLAQRFMMQDKDVLYFGSAASNRPAKLFQLVSQLFTPLMTVTAAVQTVQN